MKFAVFYEHQVPRKVDLRATFPSPAPGLEKDLIALTPTRRRFGLTHPAEGSCSRT